MLSAGWKHHIGLIRDAYRDFGAYVSFEATVVGIPWATGLTTVWLEPANGLPLMTYLFATLTALAAYLSRQPKVMQLCSAYLW